MHDYVYRNAGASLGWLKRNGEWPWGPGHGPGLRGRKVTNPVGLDSFRGRMARKYITAWICLGRWEGVPAHSQGCLSRGTRVRGLGHAAQWRNRKWRQKNRHAAGMSNTTERTARRRNFVPVQCFRQPLIGSWLSFLLTDVYSASYKTLGWSHTDK